MFKNKVSSKEKRRRNLASPVEVEQAAQVEQARTKQAKRELADAQERADKHAINCPICRAFREGAQ